MSNTLDWEDKINSPALEAWFQQFGLKYYLSAEQINEIRNTINFLLLNNTYQSNTIIEDKGFIIESGIFKANANTKWNIYGQQYTNLLLEQIPLPLASLGMKKFYRIVLNTSNTFELIVGDESDNSPAVPNKDADQLDYTIVLVDDVSIGNPTTPVVGGEYVKKIFSDTYVFNGSGSLVSIPFIPDGKSFIKLTNPSLTSISGFDFTLLTAGSEFPSEGKLIYLQNLTGNPVEIKHNDISNIEFPVLLKNEVPINIPDKEIIILRFKNVELEEVLRSWATSGSGSATFGTLTGSPDDNAALASALGDKADKSDTYTKTEINSKLSAVFVYKGSVANYAALIALTGQEIGWSYNLTDTGDNYAWDGSGWDKLSGVVDISGKEDSSNKSTSTGDSASATKFPVWSVVVSYFDVTKIKSILGISTLSGSNTGDETTGSIQTKRPLKTLGGLTTEGAGNIPLGSSNFKLVSTVDSPILTGTTSNTIVVPNILIPAAALSANTILKVTIGLKRVVPTSGNTALRWSLSNTSGETNVANLMGTIKYVDAATNGTNLYTIYSHEVEIKDSNLAILSGSSSVSNIGIQTPIVASKGSTDFSLPCYLYILLGNTQLDTQSLISFYKIETYKSS